MKSLPIRIASAIAAITLIGTTYWFGGPKGLLFLGFMICIAGAYEFYKMAFAKLNLPTVFRTVFVVFTTFFLSDLVLANTNAFMLWSVLATALMTATLSASWAKLENEKLLSAISMTILGVLYCGLLPSFALRLLTLENGITWFVFLLVIVFAGDISAYFTGNFFGKHKLMPSLSPNKTIEGALGGLVGSMIAGLAFAHYLLPGTETLVIGVGSAMAALLAQAGDLFESLVKRVADVKDSGRIMPGHGGVLDRLDGVYFAAPLVYAVSQWSVFRI